MTDIAPIGGDPRETETGKDDLSQALHSLQAPRGVRDPQTRKTLLVSLVQDGQLCINEIRLLKELLASIKLQKDIILNLPVELVLMVTDFLNEQDIASCLMVSSGWNATFMSNRVIFHLTDRLFPHLTWQSPQDSRADGPSREKLQQNFLVHLRKRLSLVRRSAPGSARLYLGNYHWDYETDFKLVKQEYSQFPTPNLPFNQRVLYAYGRIAWQRETHTLVVDDLQHKTRQILSYAGGKLMGPEMKLAAIGDRVVVATMDRHLFAWDMESGRFERKTLPSLPVRCTSFGDRVAIITDTEVYSWKLGGSLLEMTLPELDVTLLAANQFPKAFVHPHLDDVVYARQVYRNSSFSLRFMVHKFSNQKHVETFSRDIAMSWLSHERLASSLDGFLPLGHEWEPDQKDYILYEFDMYHDRFVRRAFHPGRPRKDGFMFIFDDDFAVELSERQYWVW